MCVFEKNRRIKKKDKHRQRAVDTVTENECIEREKKREMRLCRLYFNSSRSGNSPTDVLTTAAAGECTHTRHMQDPTVQFASGILHMYVCVWLGRVALSQ